MSDVDVLRISTAVDVGPLQAGMAEAANTVKASTAQMQGSFEVTEAASVRHFGDASQARHAIRGLGEELGVHMPRFVSSYLTSIGGVSTIMAAAFAPIAVIGLIEVLAQIPGMIEKGVNALRGWNEEAKKDFDEATARAVKFTLAVAEGSAQVDKAAATAGKTGAARTAAEEEALKKEMARNQAMLKNYEDQLAAAKKLKEESEGDWHKYIPLSPDMFARMFSGKEIDEAKTKIDAVKKAIEELNDKQQKLQTEKRILPITEGAELQSQARELASSQTDAIQKTAMARLETAKKATEEEYKLNKIGLDEQVAQQKAEAEQELKINLDKINAKRAQALKEQSETGKPAGPALAGLGADTVSAQESYARQIAAIETAAAEERKKQKEALDKSLLESERNYQLALIALRQQATKQAYSEHQITAGTETRELLFQEEQKFGIEQKALQQEIQQEQAQGEKKRAVVATLQGQLRTLEIQHEAAIATIQATGNAKELAEAVKQSEMELSLAESTANRALAMTISLDDKKIARHQMSAGKWIADERAAVDKWLAEEERASAKHLADLVAAGEKDPLVYQKEQDRMTQIRQKAQQDRAQIDQKEEQSVQRMAMKIDQYMFSGFNQWLQGQKTFAQAMADSWNSILMGVIQAIEQMISTWIAQEIIGVVTHKANTQLNVTTDAGRAAAGAFASVMEVVPFPFNMALAPEMAAAAFAQTMAFGSFEKGGVLDRDMLMLAHREEMVLPADLSTGLRGMIKSGNSGQGANLSLVYNAGTIIGEKTYAKKMLSNHVRDIDSLLRRLWRNHQFSPGM